MLGAQQSGHIAAVGFELYCQLLKKSVQDLKGEQALLSNCVFQADFIQNSKNSIKDGKFYLEGNEGIYRENRKIPSLNESGLNGLFESEQLLRNIAKRFNIELI